MAHDIDQWLSDLGLEQYAEALRDNDITLDIIGELSDADLVSLGLSLGHRRLLLKSARSLDAPSDDDAAHSEPVAPTSEESPSGNDAERRNLTVMFCDLVGSTNLSNRLDAERMRDLLAVYQDRAAAAIGTYEGHLARYVGDGLLVYFGYPRAHEDDPDRAVGSAMAIITAIRDLDAETNDAHLAVRIGIATGSVIVGDIGEGLRRESMAVVGETPNLAARLQTLAEPNSIVISDATWSQLISPVSVEDLGLHQLKGFDALVPALRVNLESYDQSSRDGTLHRDRFGSAQIEGLTRLVGRRAELAALERAWARAKSGVFTRAAIIGEPGIGKSRLMYEFAERLESENLSVLEGRCSMVGGTRPFAPLIEIVRAAFRIERLADRATCEGRIQVGLERLGLAGDDRISLLLSLLGVDEAAGVRAGNAEVHGHRLRRTLLEVLQARCRMVPTVVYVNDVHWIDPATRDFLSDVASSDRDLPLLLITTSRSDTGLGWQPDVTMTLRALASDELAQLITARLDVADVPAPLVSQLLEWSAGNPLFAEEMLRHLQSAGRIQRDGERISAHAYDATAGVPRTLTGLLLQRVDELSADARRCLQIASVAGRQFSSGLLENVWDREEPLAAALRSVVDEQLIVRSDSEKHPIYTFRHALVREAVYESLLGSEKTALHRRIGESLERAEDLDPDEQSARVADHFRLSDRPERAVGHLRSAGQQSLRLYSLDDAETRFRQALEIIERYATTETDEFVIDLVLDLARVLYFRGQFKGLKALLDPYQPVAERLGDPKRLARLFFEVGYGYLFSGQHERGRELAERSLELAREASDEFGQGLAKLGLSWYYIFFAPGEPGRRQHVLDLCADAFRIGRAHNDGWLPSKALLAQAFENFSHGWTANAFADSARLFELSREINDPRPQAMGLYARSIAAGMAFDHDDAIVDGDEAGKVALSPVDLDASLAGKACGLIIAGRASEGRALLEPVRERAERNENVLVLYPTECMLGVAEAMLGRMAEGVGRIERLLATLRQPENRTIGNHPTWYETMCHVYLGEIYTQIIRSERPPLKVMLANAGFLTSTLPRVRRKARHHLEIALTLSRSHEAPGTAAWCLMNLGLVERKTDAAASYLAEALENAEQAGANALARKIAAAQSGG